MKDEGQAMLVSHLDNPFLDGKDILAQVVRVDHGTGLEAHVIAHSQGDHAIHLHNGPEQGDPDLGYSVKQRLNQIRLVVEGQREGLVAREPHSGLQDPAVARDDAHTFGQVRPHVLQGVQIGIRCAWPAIAFELRPVRDDARLLIDPATLVTGQYRCVVRLLAVYVVEPEARPLRDGVLAQAIAEADLLVKLLLKRLPVHAAATPLVRKVCAQGLLTQHGADHLRVAAPVEKRHVGWVTLARQCLDQPGAVRRGFPGPVIQVHQAPPTRPREPSTPARCCASARRRVRPTSQPRRARRVRRPYCPHAPDRPAP